MLAMIPCSCAGPAWRGWTPPSCAGAPPRPGLVGPDGYLRDPQCRKPLVWDECGSAAVPSTRPAPAGAGGLLHGGAGADAGGPMAAEPRSRTPGRTGLTMTADAMRSTRPVGHRHLRRRAGGDDPAHRARIPGARLHRQTIVIDGRTLPHRPVAVTLGKTVNNGWGAFEACWSRTVLAMLVGALEVPGGTLGTTVRLNKPHDNRLLSVAPGETASWCATSTPPRPSSGRPNRRAATPIARWCPRRPLALEPGARAHAPGLDVHARGAAQLAAAELPGIWFTYPPTRRSRSGRPTT